MSTVCAMHTAWMALEPLHEILQRQFLEVTHAENGFRDLFQGSCPPRCYQHQMRCNLDTALAQQAHQNEEGEAVRRANKREMVILDS